MANAGIDQSNIEHGKGEGRVLLLPKDPDGACADLRRRLETAFGVRRELNVETAVVCTTCTGTGCAPGTSPRTCATCNGSGEIQSVQRSFLGQVMTTRACTACAGTGQQIPSPCPACRTRPAVSIG